MLIPFALAMFITFSVTPVISFLQLKLKCPQIIAALLTIAFVLMILFIVSILVTSNIKSFISQIELYQKNFLIMADQVLVKLSETGLKFDKKNIMHSLQDLPIFEYIQTTAPRIAQFFLSAVLVVIFVMFLLTGKKQPMPTRDIWIQMSKKIRLYLFTKFVTSLFTGIFTSLFLGWLGLEMAFMFGLLAFLLNFIPTMGSIVAVLLPLPVAMLQFQSVGSITLAIAVPGIMQFLIGSVLEPKIMGDALDLHPVTLLMALMFWGLLWGIPGMILATPFCVIIKLVLQQFERTIPLAELLSGRIHNDLFTA